MRYIFLILLMLSGFTYAQDRNPPLLSESAEISLLTCSPGEELYSLFGHSAMRIRDPEANIDIVFNYGTFSFNEDFYFNFAMGRLNYKLSVSSMDGFLASYEREERGMIEQVLDLDSAQKQAIFDYLDWNYKPENRYYLYDFFYDNCSSILRDVLDTTLAGNVEWRDLTYSNHPSFRNMIDTYLVYHPWGDFGIDLGLGLPCDKVPDYEEYMFLPDELSRAYDQAMLNGKPLVKQEHRLLPAAGLKAEWSITQPIPLFWLICGIVALISAWGWRKGRLLIGIDIVLLVVFGAVGALIFFLWFITDHNATANNFNMLWAWPIHWLALLLLLKRSWIRGYMIVYGAIALLTLIAMPILPQMLHLAVIPLIALVVVRALMHWKRPQAKS